MFRATKNTTRIKGACQMEEHVSSVDTEAHGPHENAPMDESFAAGVTGGPVLLVPRLPPQLQQLRQPTLICLCP
jgi:hypothetical protein